MHPNLHAASRWAAALLALPMLAAAAPDNPPASLTPCRLKGVPNQAICLTLKRPLDPAQPNGGKTIDLHVAILPGLARHKKNDAVYFFAGGPGQSAIEIAGAMAARFGRLNTQRDLVFIDQRGTGRSAPLKCPQDDPKAPQPTLAQLADNEFQARRMADCLAALKALPHGDLRQYTTTIAMADADAVRAALGHERINVIGGSYGTRAVLEYLRQYPQHVRRAIADGLAPPDGVLPQSFSPDNQAALDAMFDACQADAACAARHPDLRQRWRATVATLPRTVELAHPMTGQVEPVRLDATIAGGLLRGPLYVPHLASGLPAAIDAATRGRWQPLATLGMSLSGIGETMAAGMHFSVVCAEDWPRVGTASVQPGADFGRGFEQVYARICPDWPRGQVPAAFYQMPPARQPVLLTSGGIDPVTPPRHGERVAQALGAKARHVVVPQAGHGTTGIACLRDQMLRFITEPDDDKALALPFDCARSMPRPPAFQPLQPVGTAASGAAR